MRERLCLLENLPGFPAGLSPQYPAALLGDCTQGQDAVPYLVHVPGGVKKRGPLPSLSLMRS